MDDPALILVLVYIGLPVLLLVLQCAIGSAIERAHIKSLEAREAANADFLITNLEDADIQAGSSVPTLVTGEAVVSSDYFKTWLFSLRNIFGGESRSFTKLFIRARREATLRMIDEARRSGFDAICNVRYESADIAGNAATNASKKNTLKMASCSVSGTAYKRP